MRAVSVRHGSIRIPAHDTSDRTCTAAAFKMPSNRGMLLLHRRYNTDDVPLLPKQRRGGMRETD